MGPVNRVLGLSCLLLLSACSAPGPDAVPAATPAPDPDQLLWGGATLLQQADTEPELCLGPVQESYPPQCGGPTVVGLDWDDVEGVERSAGVTWGSAYVVGTYDGSTFTLDRPPSSSRPDGVPEPSPVPDPEHPRLCEDPYRGGDRSSEGDQAALGRALEDLDGYVTSYVSDGDSMVNVLVTGDAEEAHAELRRVWSGGLCVVQRDLPTQEATRAARDALSVDAEDLGLLTLSGMGVEGCCT
ncbi:hypothetical protein [Auraticoccus monumenti]|uniref:SPOR domain-containing protein n=1 Tax=Auraticoccus monumenti TaxID=675864 RepID=A0A1G7EI10_9ACTN|nr:hypothetical protein [Auraticoccus monumenti]SDE63283.1 hypothetical protein SAMN04489747_3951 [Auraticoccus monumenti]